MIERARRKPDSECQLCERTEKYSQNPRTTYICSHCVLAICKDPKIEELTMIKEKEAEERIRKKRGKK